MTFFSVLNINKYLLLQNLDCPFQFHLGFLFLGQSLVNAKPRKATQSQTDDKKDNVTSAHLLAPPPTEEHAQDGYAQRENQA